MASEQQFCLRWNNHQSTLVAVFDTLLESGTLVDCTLAAEGQYLKAHKVVLSACSPYFELLLSQHNEKHPIVILKDVKFQELKAMMDYMYRGEVNISQDQLGALLKAAESLQIKGLSDSGGGNERETSDRRHSRKEVAPQPPQARSPPLPHSTGLTIEHRRSAQQAAPPVVELPEDSPPGTGPHIGGSREGSVSPIPRKRKRHRRRSSTGEEGAQGLLPMTDSHDQTSSSCELPPQSQPAPAANIPAIISPVVPTPSAISRAASDPLSIGPEEQTEPELKRSSLPSSQPNISAEVLPPDPEPVQKLEPPSEILLEPKSEYLDDTMNEDSVENLTTLDDVDDMDDARPGPSHGGEGSSNQGSGFAPWHVRATERTTDEVFMAAQEAVGAHRDSQGFFKKKDKSVYKCPKCYFVCKDKHSLLYHIKQQCQKRKHLLPQTHMLQRKKKYSTRQAVQKHYDTRRKSQEQEQENPDLVTTESTGLEKFRCQRCDRVYQHSTSLNRHLKYECGVEPRFGCPHCTYRCKYKKSLDLHMSNQHSTKGSTWKSSVGNSSTLFECGTCGEKYSHLAQLVHHQENNCIFQG
ncbi:hypothetical protein R5R35_014202 [Gryllus longicercus]|uniref:Longitudinals lacking protein n=1 Tax=Gryllus longicercus TaxID=2509291 RepID=A0AAN9VW17_9ORTH